MTNPHRSGAALIVGFVLLSLNARAAFGQLGPLVPYTGFDARIVALLGMVPPLGMAVAAPFAPLLLRRAGEDRLLFWASFFALAGAMGRPFGPWGLVCGTAVTALAIGVINVLVPVYVRRRFPGSGSGAMFGVYALALGVGAALAAAVAAPVAEATGHWQPAIATAVIPALLGVIGGLLMLDRGADRHDGADASGSPGAHLRVATTWLAWSLLCFFGVQTLLFYGLLAWLPPILLESGASAGEAALGQTILIAGVAAGGFAAPLLAARRPSQTGAVAVVVALTATGLCGLGLAGSRSLVVWVVVLGVGLGGGQALPAVLYARRGSSRQHTASLSAFAQTGGYLLASAGPLLLSALRDGSGSWAFPLVAAGVLCVANLALSWTGSRDRT